MPTSKNLEVSKLLLLPAVSLSLSSSLVYRSSLVVGVCSERLPGKVFDDEISEACWLRIVRNELDFCSSRIGDLTWRHRMQACDLLDWYHSTTGNYRNSWLSLYPNDKECFRRLVVAELNWCSSHVKSLSRRRRILAIDLMCDVEQTAPELFRDCWSTLLDFG